MHVGFGMGQRMHVSTGSFSLLHLDDCRSAQSTSQQVAISGHIAEYLLYAIVLFCSLCSSPPLQPENMEYAEHTPAGVTD